MTQTIQLDATARQLLIHSVLRHSLQTQILLDNEIRELANDCVEFYDILSGFRKWQLGPKDKISGASYQFKVTEYVIGATVAYLKENEFVQAYDSTILRAKRPWNQSDHESWSAVWLPPYDFDWVKQGEMKC